MTSLTRASFLALLSAMILAAALAGCERVNVEERITNTDTIERLNGMGTNGPWSLILQILKHQNEQKTNSSQSQPSSYTMAYPTYERTMTIPVAVFEKLIGYAPPDTNFIARMEFVAARLSREELQNSNNWAAMRTILGQIDQRLQAAEARVSTSMVQTNHPVIASPAPQVIPPLQSAPQVPPIEKEKP